LEKMNTPAHSRKNKQITLKTELKLRGSSSVGKPLSVVSK